MHSNIINHSICCETNLHANVSNDDLNDRFMFVFDESITHSIYPYP